MKPSWADQLWAGTCSSIHPGPAGGFRAYGPGARRGRLGAFVGTDEFSAGSFSGLKKDSSQPSLSVGFLPAQAWPSGPLAVARRRLS